MNLYTDSNGLYHDKPCKDGKPSSNNWMIYTAYAKLLKLPLDMTKAKSYFNDCVVTLQKGEIVILRHPDKKEPPLSFDEILGAYILGLVSYSQLKANHFVFHGKGEKMNPNTVAKIVAGATELLVLSNTPEVRIDGLEVRVTKRKVDRNTFWKKKVKNLYQGAFRMNPGQVWFFKKHAKATIHKEDSILKDLYVEHTLKYGKSHEVLVLWALAKMAGQSKLASRCKSSKLFAKDFPKDHPFN